MFLILSIHEECILVGRWKDFDLEHLLVLFTAPAKILHHSSPLDTSVDTVEFEF